MSEPEGDGCVTVRFALPDIVASPACPPVTSWLFSFNGRQPECEKHDALKGVPHAPCWSIVKVEHGG